MDKNIENNPMNHNIFAGQWKQMRGTLKSWWGKLSDDDFEWIEGQKDKLIGLVQEKYGYTRDQAQDEVDRRLNEYDDKDSSAGVQDMTAKVYGLGKIAASKARGAVAALANEFATAGVCHTRKQIGDHGYRPQGIHSQTPFRIAIRWNRPWLLANPQQKQLAGC